MAEHCRACERELPPDARFCPACGAPVGAGPIPERQPGSPARRGRRTDRSRRGRAGEAVTGWLGPYRTPVMVALGLTVLLLLFIGTQNRSRSPEPGMSLPGLSDLSRQLQEAQARLLQEPDNPAVIVTAANLFFDTGDYDQAVTLYRRALEIIPDDPEVRTDLGTALSRLGRGPEAIDEFLAVLEKKPGFTTAKFNLGVVYTQLHDIANARTWFERTVRDDPGSSLAFQAQAQLDSLGSR
jgi:tetratricopeptide (TPR) repeat protein